MGPLISTIEEIKSLLLGVQGVMLIQGGLILQILQVIALPLINEIILPLIRIIFLPNPILALILSKHHLQVLFKPTFQSNTPAMLTIPTVITHQKNKQKPSWSFYHTLMPCQPSQLEPHFITLTGFNRKPRTPVYC